MAVEIDLVGTVLEGRSMDRLERLGDTDWISCEVDVRQFRGFGGAGNLAEIINVFLDWAR